MLSEADLREYAEARSLRAPGHVSNVRAMATELLALRTRLAEVERQRDNVDRDYREHTATLSARIDRIMADGRQATDALREIRAQQKEDYDRADRLATALARYGRHDDDCQRWQGGCPYDTCVLPKIDETQPCTCGLDEARREPR